MKQLFTLNINGESKEVWTSTHKTLLEVLREDLYLTGTKHGCELGECGACSVLTDGEPVLACLILPIEVQGQEIQTIEGLAKNGVPDTLQTAFAEQGASQCGYCSPAMLMTAKALLDNKSRIGKSPYFFEVTDAEAIDLDNEFDFNYLEFYVQNHIPGPNGT